MADEVRMIDANVLIKCLTEWYDSAYPHDKEIIEMAILDVNNTPTIESEPVKYGRWLDNGMVYTCSECNSSVPKNIFVVGCDFKGCPYCFARMDGDSE